ncbi:MAG: AraC family transcriptional activator of pobA [Desulforhopalus sp.]|jgi:AraC family transcriptional activator of pobA
MNASDIPRVDFYKKANHPIEFEIMDLEGLFARGKKISPRIDHPHRVKFNTIIFITGGKGTHHIDFQPYPFSQGSLIFTSVGQVHAFDIQPGVKGYLVLFTRDFLEKNLIHSDVVSLYRLYNHQMHAPVIQPQETEGVGFNHLFKEIMREYGNSEFFAKEEILRLFLKMLLLKAERIKRTVTTEQKNTEWLIRFGHFKEHLEKHIVSTRSVTEFAGMLNISAKHLNTICKAVSGETAKQFIDNYMILEIKRLLATSDSSVQEISYDFGFGEPTNFVKYFKKHSGKSPSQFRKALTN